MSVPTSMRSDGRLRVAFVPTTPGIDDPTDPILSEITAGTTKEGSCYLTSTGFQNTVQETPVTDDRMCTTQTFERVGRKLLGLTLMYVYNLTSENDNIWYTALTELNTGFIVARYGIPYDTAWAAGDVVDIYPVECGFQLKMPKEDNSVFRVTQVMRIIDEYQADVELAAS